MKYTSTLQDPIAAEHIISFAETDINAFTKDKEFQSSSAIHSNNIS